MTTAPSLAPRDPTPAPAASVTLKGTGSKTGATTTLGGDYTLKTNVTAKPGCSWSVSLDPGYGEVDSFSTDSAGSQSDELPVSLDPGSYRLVVRATKCGIWSVTLRR